MKFVLDTNVFNRLADGQLTLGDLPKDSQFVATHIQIDEIKATHNESRRSHLLRVFNEVAPDVIPTESGVWDVSKWDEFKWGDEVTYQQIKMAIDTLNAGKENNIQDALIAETALKNDYGLVTSDVVLATVMKGIGLNVVFID